MGHMRTWSRGTWVLAAMLLGSCTSAPADSGDRRPVVVVNDLKLTAKDLRREIEMESPDSVRPTPNGEPEWLARVIERELLIQEGRRMGLDREQEFMRSIERFWKEALIKQVVLRKAREISSQVQVYAPEIEERYQLWLKEQKGTPESLELKRPEIERVIRRQKEADAMEKWVAGLRERASVKIDRQALEKIR